MNQARSRASGGEARRPEAASGTAYGVDGCKAGWFYFAHTSRRQPDWGVVEAIEELITGADDSDRIFVDIPIGLPDGAEGRLCDKEARQRLRAPRASSVFPAPARAALAAGTYDEAKRLSRQASGKQLSRQTFAIVPKISEVDNLVRGSTKARHIVREIHPEICFWALAGGSSMRHRKKTGAGFDERLALLERFHPSAGWDFVRVRADFRCWDLADDDILDAMAAAVTASADPRALRTLPEVPATDTFGLPMEMVYAPEASFAT